MTPVLSYQKILPKQFLALQNQHPNLVLFDVRTQEEYEMGRLPDAKLLPIQWIPYVLSQVCPDKNLTYVLYCRSGSRSQDAARYMIEQGYHQVYDLGGILDWPYDIIK